MVKETMNKKQAESIMNLSLEICDKLDDIIDIIETLTEEEKMYYKQKLGEVMLVINFDFIMSIAKQYPDLNPDVDV